MNEAILKPAGFWIRFFALVIDGIILGIPTWIIMFAVGIAGHIILSNVIIVALGIAYYVGFLSSSWQATPGKRLLSVYVVRDEDGGRLNQSRALKRYVVFQFPYFLLMIAGIFLGTAMTTTPVGLTEADQARYTELNAKVMRMEGLTSEEQEFMSYVTVAPMLQNMNEADKKKFLAVQKKWNAGQELTADEQQFFDQHYDAALTAPIQYMTSGPGLVMNILTGLSFLYSLVIACMVAFSENKKGLHDRVCKTQALRGKPYVI